MGAHAVNGARRAYIFKRPLSYSAAIALQESLLLARIAEHIPDVMLVLDHLPVVTLGRRGRTQHLLASTVQLQHMGIDVYPSSRGGDVTFHNPGQVVMYPIVNVSELAKGARGFLGLLESTAIQAAQRHGLTAFCRPEMAGAWCAGGKLAAIGFSLRRWVSHHGLAVNVENSLHGFSLIHGCGLVGEPVTSWRAELGQACPSLEEVRMSHIEVFREKCGHTFCPVTVDSPEEVLYDLSMLPRTPAPILTPFPPA